MINIMSSGKESRKACENTLDPQLWHACAGGMVQMPPVNSRVYYFPQGHIEHAQANVDFKNYPKIPALVPCRISTIKYLADLETDAVYTKIRLIPMSGDGFDFDDDRFSWSNDFESSKKPASFAKTLTQSDANNGGGFSVPRYCAETIFPRLDYSADPPVQTISAKDVHGVIWKFRHIYRGNPRRHLLTTGWSNFVNQKKLLAGDSVVFLRTEDGDLCVGVRRVKSGIGCGPESPSAGWNSCCGSFPFGGYAAVLRADEIKISRNSNGFRSSTDVTARMTEKLRAESVIEAACLAANGQPFEVIYYPRASTPEFCVKASAVKAAMQFQWSAGMRFKMPFETEDSSRISWFMGTISSVQVANPVHWPLSPWRLLQVAWDEPYLLQNVKRVNPWLVEPVASMPSVHMSPFSPPRKKLQLLQPHDFPLVDQLPLILPFSSDDIRPSSPFCCVSNNNSAGIQGDRHAHLGQSLSDLHINKLQSGLFGAPRRFSGHTFMCKPNMNDDISCLLKTESHNLSSNKSVDTKTPKFILFGKPILTEDQISESSSRDFLRSSSNDDNLEETAKLSDKINAAFPSCGGCAKTEVGTETVGHCKVFMDSKDVGQTLDLSIFGSYEEIYKKLTNIFGLGRSEMRST
ncbi:hypothetical protein Nepgr_009746 [Nepenthes gracilis]|uniref:Auxin response factor n=1 Tax=Nepenthes gracilis TaxID=150966 RepID=A0AAD3XKQ2_NEPGR|nr:hypothetical protein Nepgr_009746 [Nepenthes gracilis]